MSELKLPAASGGGSISIKGPSSSSSDVDLLDTSGNIKLSDSQKVKLGTGDDLEIWHDGSHSRITAIDSGTGRLIISGRDSGSAGDIGLQLNADVSEEAIICRVDQGVELYYNGAKKLETASDKVMFYGHAKVDSDNAYDLGAGGARWKDLYLSGGLFLGGTGSANEIEDYEEGTWTPDLGNFSALSFNSRSGRYTKIGRFVYAAAHFNIASRTGGGGHMTLTGLPFTSVAQNAGGGGYVFYSAGLSGDTWGVPTLIVDQNQTQGGFYKASGATFASQDMNFSSGSMHMYVIYEAA